MKPPLTDAHKQAICEEGARGTSAAYLAGCYGVSRAQIYQYWQAGGVQRPQRPERMRQYSFSLAPALANRLQGYCEKEGLSFSLAVACAVEEFLERRCGE